MMTNKKFLGYIRQAQAAGAKTAPEIALWINANTRAICSAVAVELALRSAGQGL